MRLIILVVGILVLAASLVLGTKGFADLEPYIDTVERAEAGMTLWQMIKSGGICMVILGFISVALVAFVIYFFLYLKESRLAPLEFGQDAVSKLAGKKFNLLREICTERENIISKVILAGLDKAEKGPEGSREAAEVAAKNEISKLWESLSYLADMAAIAPLVGLLGTVLGMMQAFNTIAFQSAVVKPIVLAGGVSKAMVTTAAGLTIAIPAMIFYALFRSRILKITAEIEAVTSEIVDVFARMEKKT